MTPDTEKALVNGRCKDCRFWQCQPRFYMNGSDFSEGECRYSPHAISTGRDFWCGKFEARAERELSQ